MKTSFLSCILLLPFLFSSCGVNPTITSPEYAKQTNQKLKSSEFRQHPLTAQEKETLQNIAILWNGNASFEAVKKDKRKMIRIARIVSIQSPSYPMGPLIIGAEASVLVSFIIDEKGNVEAAKVLESSDSRFNHSAIAAVKKWKFLPALSATGPRKMISCVPFRFKVRE